MRVQAKDGMTMNASVGTAPKSRWLRPAVLDRAEQVAIVILWIFLAWRVGNSDNPFAPLLLATESAVAVFVLIRRPTEAISMELGDWMLAITATFAAMLISPGKDLFPQLASLGVSLVLFGNCVQLWAKLTLRRSFGIAPANRGVKISGPYAFVRHPMYAGYLFAHIGLALLMPSLLNLAIWIISWWAQILRLLAEERLLSQDPAYSAFKERVRWRLVPGIF